MFTMYVVDVSHLFEIGHRLTLSLGSGSPPSRAKPCLLRILGVSAALKKNVFCIVSCLIFYCITTCGFLFGWPQKGN